MSSIDEKSSKEVQSVNVVIQAVDEEEFPDGGLRAWLVVIGCFIITAVSFGFFFIWGVFQAYYSEGILAGTSPSTLSLLGSIPGAVTAILSVVTGKLADRYAHKPMIAIGCVTWVLMMLGTAFSTKLWHFILTQGIMQGIASSFFLPTASALPSQWFRKKRAFATGIVMAGSPLGAAVTSAMIRVMLSHLGLRKTLLIKAGIDATVLGVAYLLIKERRKTSTPIVWYDKKYLTDPAFWSVTLCMCLVNFGFPAPLFYMPTFAKEKIPALTELLSALTITILNLSSGIGRCWAGFFADRIGPTNAMFFVIVMSGLAQLLIWNFISDYPGIMAMSVFYGFFGISFLSLATPVCAHFYGTENLAGLTGLFYLLSAPGVLLGPPITGAIYDATKNWHCVIAFSGTVQILGAIVLLYAMFKKDHLFSRFTRAV